MRDPDEETRNGDEAVPGDADAVGNPLRIGSALVEDGAEPEEGDEDAIRRSVTSVGQDRIPGSGPRTVRGSGSLGTPGLRIDVMENHDEEEER